LRALDHAMTGSVNKLPASTARAIDALRTGFTNDPEGLYRYAVETVCEHADAQVGLWYEFGMVCGKALPVRWHVHGMSDEPLRRWVSEGITWTHADPRKPRPQWIGRFRTTRQWTPNLERDYYPTPFYQRVIARARIRDQLRMLVAHRGTVIAWIGSFRLEGEPEHQRADQRRVAPLRQALVDALTSVYVSTRAGSAEEGADLVLTPTGRIELASGGGRVLARNPEIRRELTSWVRDVDAGLPALPVIAGMLIKWTRLYAPGRVRYLLHLEPAGPVRLDPSSRLTPTQREVAMLACAGLSATEIGANLDMKELTVRSHLKAVYERLQISSRAELVWVLEGRSPSIAKHDR